MDISTQDIPDDDKPMNDELDFELPPGVDYYERTDEFVRQRIHELLAEAGISVDELKEEAKKDEFSSYAAERLWFMYDDCIDEFT